MGGHSVSRLAIMAAKGVLLATQSVLVLWLESQTVKTSF